MGAPGSSQTKDCPDGCFGLILIDMYACYITTETNIPILLLIYLYEDVCVCVCVGVCVRAFACVCMFVCLHVCVYVSMHIHTENIAVGMICRLLSCQ